MSYSTKVKMFGLDFDSCGLQEATGKVINYAKKAQKGLVVTPNVDHVMMLQDDKDMLQVFQNALLRFADGMPLVWFSWIAFGKCGLKERVTGADLLISICEAASRYELTVYFLGGNPGVAEQAAINLKEMFPKLMVTGFYSPPFGFENDEVESQHIVDTINSLGVDILFVGVGSPKQEKWAYANLGRLDVGPILGVGAAFDFAAGIKKRAPKIVRNSGLEWAWRLFLEPKRLWRRYILRDSRFLGLAIREYRRIKAID